MRSDDVFSWRHNRGPPCVYNLGQTMSGDEPFAVSRAKKMVNSVALRSMFIAGFAYYEIGR